MYDWSYFAPDASKNVATAIRLDSQGSRGMAIQSYQRAIEALVKLVQIYPDYKLNKVYRRGSAHTETGSGRSRKFPMFEQSY